MNREIKFRAWSKILKEMLSNVQNHIGSDDWAFGRMLNGDDCTVMQYTGLKEAKHLDGKEVYESDIIKNIDTGALQVVYWNEDKAAWYCEYIEDEREEKRIVSLSDSIGNLNEVIGNIHENPELIK